MPHVKESVSQAVTQNNENIWKLRVNSRESAILTHLNSRRSLWKIPPHSPRLSAFITQGIQNGCASDDVAGARGARALGECLGAR